MDYSNFRAKIETPQWTQAQEQILLEPYTYVSANPGKEIRTRLIDAFNLWLHVPEDDLEIIRRVVRMLHNASLLMDDVEDDSELRRGIPVAHTIYGIPQTINTANYVYFLAFEELFKLKSGSDLGSESELVLPSESSGTSSSAVNSGLNGGESESNGETKGQGKGKGKEKVKEQGFVTLVTEELLNLHRGQGLDLFWRDSLTCPTEEEYIHMVLGKTGGLFRIAVKLMMAKSASEVDYVPLVNLISVFFQIRDDYLNLQSTEYADNKGYCEDLTEGKFSFPVVHGVRADTSNRQILNVLQKRTTSRSLKSHTVDYLRTSTRSFEYSRHVLGQLYEQITEEIRSLGGNKDLDSIMKLLGVPEG